MARPDPPEAAGFHAQVRVPSGARASTAEADAAHVARDVLTEGLYGLNQGGLRAGQGPFLSAMTPNRRA